MLRHVFSLSQKTSELISHLVGDGEKQSEYVDGCLSTIQMGVFQQVLCLFHTFPRFSLLLRHRGKKTHQPPPEEIWIVYVMKDILYRLQYHFSWSRRYDAYALGKRDELVRCAFLMAHLLFEWVGGLVRRPPQIRFWSSLQSLTDMDLSVSAETRRCGCGADWEEKNDRHLWGESCRLAEDEYCMVPCSRGQVTGGGWSGPPSLPVAVSISPRVPSCTSSRLHPQ